MKKKVNSNKKSSIKHLCIKKIIVPLQTQTRNGALTERLGSGLQNRPQQFESAGHLFSKAITVP